MPRPLDPFRWVSIGPRPWWGQGAKPLAREICNEFEATISLRTLGQLISVLLSARQREYSACNHEHDSCKFE